METSDLVLEAVKNSITVFFGLLQLVIVSAVGGVVKLWLDVRDLRKDMDAAFDKIREVKGEPTRCKKE